MQVLQDVNIGWLHVLTLADPLRGVAVELVISTMATLRLPLRMLRHANPRELTMASTYRAGMQGRQSYLHTLRQQPIVALACGKTDPGIIELQRH